MTPTSTAIVRTCELSQRAATHAAAAATRASDAEELHRQSRERLGRGRRLLDEAEARVGRGDRRARARAVTRRTE